MGQMQNINLARELIGREGRSSWTPAQPVILRCCQCHRERADLDFIEQGA
jgi:hypothetical protein